MLMILVGIAYLATFAVLLPMVVLNMECWVALLPGRKQTLAPKNRPPCAVLIPAHNEEEGLAATLENVRGQLRPSDRLVVIADNCNDNTAAVARAGGAEVVVRQDGDRRG